MVGQIKPVKLISGMLSADKDILSEAKDSLRQLYGGIDAESPVIPFDFTDYYNSEMGEGILRQYISFERLISPGDIADIKCSTIRMEDRFRINGRRRVNIDPGYLTLDKLVLATTKDGSYRVYLGEGIYAQSTIFFQKGSFMPWQWTYPDYRTDTAIDFFNRVRAVYRTAVIN